MIVTRLLVRRSDFYFLSEKHNGILGSNNLRDVKPYVEEFSLEHMTTGDILIEAFKA